MEDKGNRFEKMSQMGKEMYCMGFISKHLSRLSQDGKKRVLRYMQEMVAEEDALAALGLGPEPPKPTAEERTLSLPGVK